MWLLCCLLSDAWQDLFLHENLGVYVDSFTGANIPANGVQMLQLFLAD